jgi:hypothetical protein
MAAVRNGEFLASPTHHKSVILSGALHTSVARNSACSAKSKDPEGAYLTDAARSFLTTETAAIEARFTLKSAATFICGSCEIWGSGGRKALSSAGNVSAAEVLRLRATSSVSRDRCVKRSAQDDDFVGISRKTAESDDGLRPSFSVHVRLGERGAPVDYLRCLFRGARNASRPGVVCRDGCPYRERIGFHRSGRSLGVHTMRSPCLGHSPPSYVYGERRALLRRLRQRPTKLGPGACFAGPAGRSEGRDTKRRFLLVPARPFLILLHWGRPDRSAVVRWVSPPNLLGEELRSDALLRETLLRSSSSLQVQRLDRPCLQVR